MTDLPAILQKFHDEKLGMFLRHQAAARLIKQYDVNNTYQYIINREEVQLSWLESALLALGGTVSDQVDGERAVSGKNTDVPKNADTASVLREDLTDAGAFVDRWEPRVEVITNARHRGMLRVILGETLEHKHFFELALAGRSDLLGRRAEEIGPARGEVLPTRWIE